MTFVYDKKLSNKDINDIKKWMLWFKPQYAITIRFGDEISASDVTRQKILFYIVNRFDRKLLGPKFFKKKELRTKSYLIMEYEKYDNPHAHGIIAFHEDNLKKIRNLSRIRGYSIDDDGSLKFKNLGKICPDGDVLLKPIHDIDGWVHYFTKTRNINGICTS